MSRLSTLSKSFSTGFPFIPPFSWQRANFINLLASHIVFIDKKAFKQRFLGNNVLDSAGKCLDIR